MRHDPENDRITHSCFNISDVLAIKLWCDRSGVVNIVRPNLYSKLFPIKVKKKKKLFPITSQGNYKATTF